METLASSTLVTATGGHGHCSPPFSPYAYAAAPRWAYAGAYAPYAAYAAYPAYAAAPWAPRPAAWWPAYR